MLAVLRCCVARWPLPAHVGTAAPCISDRDSSGVTKPESNKVHPGLSRGAFLYKLATCNYTNCFYSPLRCLTACTRLAPDEAARPRSSRYANSGSQRAHARRRGAHPTRQCSAAMSAAIRLDLLPSAAKGRPSGGSYAAAETCAEIPRRAHGGQRRMRLSTGVGHLHGAPWPCSSDVHHVAGQ